MPTALSHNRGIAPVEVLLAAAIIALAATGFVGAAGIGVEGAVRGGEHARAAALAAEGLEAVRSIRDDDFGRLANGSHGIGISGGGWTLSGSSDTTGQFTRTVAITEPESNVKRITATVTWGAGARRTGEVVLVTDITNWRRRAQEQGGGQGGGNGGPGGGSPPGAGPPN